MLVDLAIASVVTVPPLLFQAFDAGEVGASLDALDLVCAALAFALVMLRRRAPLLILGVSVVAGVWSLIPDDDQIVLRVVACVALYTVASTYPRGIAWSAGVISGIVLFAAATITRPEPWYDGDNLELIAWAALATVAGDAVRSRRAYIVAREERAAALRERAERAEAALEEEARRQVVEERLRIARELHDVVAHHIAVINVQAGVASHLLRDDPSEAEEALGHVRRGVSSVLDEIAGILSVLRQVDDRSSPTDPLPTLDRLDRLVASFSGVGLDVEWHTSGSRRPVDPAVGLTAYRIVQESLTNAHRHGDSPQVCLRVDYLGDTLSVEVVNDVAADTAERGRSGHGIVGMRERVAAIGGTIDIGPTADGRFRVHAVLPTTGEDR